MQAKCMIIFFEPEWFLLLNWKLFFRDKRIYGSNIVAVSNWISNIIGSVGSGY